MTLNKRIAYHTIFWLFYLLLSTYLVASYDWNFYRAFMAELIELPVKVLAAYCLLYFVLPRYVKAGSYAIPLLLTLLIVTGAALLHRLLIYAIVQPVFWPDSTFYFWNFAKLAGSVFSILSVSAIVIAIKLFGQKFDDARYAQELEKEKLKAELAFLRGQVNPHFLFNTLNNIYALALKQSEQTPQAVLKLSDLLRYILKGGTSETIGIGQEIKVLEDYIELERLRYGDRLDLQLIKNIDNDSQPVLPMLLVAFAENCFKHGASESLLKSKIAIRLKLENGMLDFLVKNSVEKRDVPATTEGTGLANIKRQLDLVYGPAYTLEIGEPPGEFVVHLTINLKAHAKAQLPDR